jgi:hypothetical protein
MESELFADISCSILSDNTDIQAHPLHTETEFMLGNETQCAKYLKSPEMTNVSVMSICIHVNGTEWRYGVVIH